MLTFQIENERFEHVDSIIYPEKMITQTYKHLNSSQIKFLKPSHFEFQVHSVFCTL